MENQPEDEHIDPHADEGGPVKSFLEHLEDLRWVLIKSSAAILVGFIICLISGDKIVSIIIWPKLRAERMQALNEIHSRKGQWVTFMFGTNLIGHPMLVNTNDNPVVPVDLVGTNNNVVLEVGFAQAGANWMLTVHPSTNAPPEETSGSRIQLSNFGPAAGFMVAFQIAIYAGLLLASPFIFYFIGTFIFPALKIVEKRYIFRGLAVGIGLFFMGVTFCYFFLLPLALKASVAYSTWLGFSANIWKAEEYISFVCKFMLGMGLGFEMPVVILVLVKLGIVTADQLASFRKYMVVINLILGAVLTTPEVITQIMMAVPLQVLYEISIFLARRMEKKKKQDEERAMLSAD